MRDRYAEMRKLLTERVLRGKGALDPTIRAAAAQGDALPEALAGYVATVREHAYRVTDADIAALKAAGYSEDQIFEVTVSAALGAATTRLDAGLAAIAAARPAVSESAGDGVGDGVAVREREGE